MKQCEICGDSNPQSGFSKSYPKRCRVCVAKAKREARSVESKNEVAPEDRRYELAKAAMCALLGNPSIFRSKINPCAIAKHAVNIANEIADELENPTAEVTE